MHYATVLPSFHHVEVRSSSSLLGSEHIPLEELLCEIAASINNLAPSAVRTIASIPVH